LPQGQDVQLAVRFVAEGEYEDLELLGEAVVPGTVALLGRDERLAPTVQRHRRGSAG
jgi:hypothetical protein